MTSSPACASGSAATPPTAPSPMMTTSVFLSSVAIVSASVIERCARGPPPGEHPVVVGGHVSRCRPRVQLLLVAGDGQANAWIAHEIPSHEVRIAPVIGVAECPLNRVGENQVEECRGLWESRGGIAFDLSEDGVLIGGGQTGERIAPGALGIVVQCGKAGTIGLAKRCERSTKRAVDVLHRARLGRAWSVAVGRNQAGGDRTERFGLGGG